MLTHINTVWPESKPLSRITIKSY